MVTVTFALGPGTNRSGRYGRENDFSSAHSGPEMLKMGQNRIKIKCYTPKCIFII